MTRAQEYAVEIGKLRQTEDREIFYQGLDLLRMAAATEPRPLRLLIGDSLIETLNQRLTA